VIRGGLAAGAIATLVPLALNPQVLHQYADAMANRPPEQWVSPTLGTLLRLALGAELFRLQFVPVAVGLLWFAWHRRKTARTWNWTEQMPLLLLVSFVTAPYGAWPFDMVLLLPAVVKLIASVRARSVSDGSTAAPVAHAPGSDGRAILAALVAVNLGCLALNVSGMTSFWFLWVGPTVLALYALGTRRRSSPAPALSPSPSEREAVPV